MKTSPKVLIRDPVYRYWSPNLTLCTASENQHVGILFVEKSKVEEFKGLVNDGQTTVDEKFQYGQANKAGDKRFLVYHNKDNKPYQHRFINNMLTKYGPMGAQALENMGMTGSQEMAELVANYVGDSLRNFK